MAPIHSALLRSTDRATALAVWWTTLSSQRARSPDPIADQPAVSRPTARSGRPRVIRPTTARRLETHRETFGRIAVEAFRCRINGGTKEGTTQDAHMSQVPTRRSTLPRGPVAPGSSRGDTDENARLVAAVSCASGGAFAEGAVRTSCGTWCQIRATG